MRPKHFLSATTLFLYCTMLHGQTAPSASAAEGAVKTASAPTPPSPVRAAKIEEMLTVTGVKPTLLKTMEQGQERIKVYAEQQAHTQRPVPKERETDMHQITDAYISVMSSIAESQLTWDKLKPALLQYCADTFTDKQMDSIIAFYESPAGKAMLEKSAALNKLTYNALLALQAQTKPLTDQATKDMQNRVQGLAVQVSNVRM